MVDRSQVIIREKPQPDSEPKSRFQRGIDMITNFANVGKDILGQTGTSMGDYFSAVSSNRDNNRGALLRDAGRFIPNQAYLTGEFLGDIFQIPFESVGQRYIDPSIGSGYGKGDMFFDSDDPVVKFKYDQFMDDYVFDTPTDVANNPSFQNYLRGQGFNIPDEGFDLYSDIFNLGDLFRDFNVSPPNPQEEAFLGEFKQAVNNPESQFFVSQKFDKDGNLRMAEDGTGPYEKELLDALNNFYNLKEAEFVDSYFPGYMENQYPQMVEGLARELNISPLTAQMFMDKGGEPLGFFERDMGLLNDAISFEEPLLDYETDEGQALFGDDFLMNMAGGLGTYGLARNLLTKGTKLLPNRVGSVVKNLYPATFSQQIPLNRTTSLRFSSLPRGILQTGAAMMFPEYFRDTPNYKETPDGLDLTIQLPATE
jgi:hypothetical protein